MRPFVALRLFFKALFDGDFARRAAELADGPKRALPPPPPPKPPLEGPAALLGLMQREARFLDFVQEDVSGYADAQVGAAARAVHAGLGKVFAQYVKLGPVLPEAEGAPVVVPAGFDPAAVRLSGRVLGDPPFKGVLRHHGWLVVDLNLPQPPAGQTPGVITPAEVEIP